MRRRRVWLLIAGVGIASGVGIALDSGHKPDLGQQADSLHDSG
jgi:hypothetical protein